MDSNFCFVERQFSISSPTELLIDFEQVNVSCFGEHDGLLHARVSGGSSIHINIVGRMKMVLWYKIRSSWLYILENIPTL